MQHVSMYLPLIVLFIVIFIHQRNEKMLIKKIIASKKGDKTQMKELAKRFIDKECIIYTFNSQLMGTVREVADEAILLENNGTTEAVNLDFVIRIREYPRKKNGKKKNRCVLINTGMRKGANLLMIAPFSVY